MSGGERGYGRKEGEGGARENWVSGNEVMAGFYGRISYNENVSAMGFRLSSFS